MDNVVSKLLESIKRAYDKLAENGYDTGKEMITLSHNSIWALVNTIVEQEAAAPKWISVEERLPEICDLVLVIASGKPKENIELINAVLIASHWGDEGWIADGYDGWDKLKVSHWMPLPELPEEEV